MSSGDGPVEGDLVPDAEVLIALGADDWARLLPVLRRALQEVAGEQETGEVRRLREMPAGRLASGPGRRQLCELITTDPQVRASVARCLATDLPDELREALNARAAPDATSDRRRRGGGTGHAGGDAGSTAARRAERAQRRLREAREERDGLARRLTGAVARADRAEREVAHQRSRIEELERETERLRARLRAADEQVERAAERERRRGQAEVGRLQEQLRELRRREHERDQREQREQRRGPGPVRERGGAASSGSGQPAPPRCVPGRPTRLPETVARGTAEEVDHLLSPGRLVVVDGYNVTRTHRSDLDLAGQRDWLVRRLATLTAQRRVRPVVVFDGERASGGRPAVGGREVEVRFTPAGITADDELVLLVEALDEDEPVVAVTDDRELRDRLLARRVDVVGTGPFLWATPA